MVFAGFASAKPVVIRPELNFEIPEEVLKLTNPNPNSLPTELTSPASVTYADMKDELRAKTKYGNGLSLHNASGQNVLIVANGKPVYFERDGRKVGLFNMVDKSASPISFEWFEKFGDPLIIGMFPLETDNRIIRGYVFALRFQDLIDPQGNLRKLGHVIPAGTPPLANIRVYHAKPRDDQYRFAKVVELKPGVKPLVIVRNSNPGPIVEMERMKVSPKTAETLVVSDETATMSPKAATPSVNDWAKIRRVIGAEGKIIALMVERVTEGSPYDLAGLRAGMQITGYGRRPGSLDLHVSYVLDCGLVVENTLCVDEATIRDALMPQPLPEVATAPVAQVGTQRQIPSASTESEAATEVEGLQQPLPANLNMVAVISAPRE